MNQEYGIHWFRRDLRVPGNPALLWNAREHDGRVLGLFCFDAAFLGRTDFSANRFQFFLQTLRQLRLDLRDQGGDLLILDKGPDEAFPLLWQAISKCGQPLPQSCGWNRDYEPFARARDARIERHLTQQGTRIHITRDHLLIEPHEVYRGNDPDAGYQVYTPFARRWKDVFHTENVQQRLRDMRRSAALKLRWADILGAEHPLLQTDTLELYMEENSRRVTIESMPAAGHRAAREQLRVFTRRLDQYAVQRDFPAIPATSGLSVYFKNGSITVAGVIAELHKKYEASPAYQKFFHELIWREFFYHILFRNPRVEREAFQTRYRKIKWKHNARWFQAWQTGRTGFPIVDAGMRELMRTGNMHNRVRMIVASFLVKDLLIDWRRGEEHFMHLLLDGDLAANNGGWQWAASTGCDAQPYFRIFNPWTQSKKFDADGEYIRRWIPELKSIPAAELHK
ncbi:MAG: deoxyribodipyrimidine photo-lyase, partial [Leptospiraceae bacterium]|nr:deoxyribodipyrimidine photo-lyase [Leptospiraceae bacterium]